MDKQELIEKLDIETEIVYRLPFDSLEETQGFLNALKIAKTYSEQLVEPSERECEVLDRKYWSGNGTEDLVIKCCNSNKLIRLTLEDDFYNRPKESRRMYNKGLCPNCGAKIKRGESNA